MVLHIVFVIITCFFTDQGLARAIFRGDASVDDESTAENENTVDAEFEEVKEEDK